MCDTGTCGLCRALRENGSGPGYDSWEAAEELKRLRVRVAELERLTSYIDAKIRAALVAERERALEDAATAAERSQPDQGFDWNLGRMAIYRVAKIRAADAIRALRERP